MKTETTPKPWRTAGYILAVALCTIVFGWSVTGPTTTTVGTFRTTDLQVDRNALFGSAGGSDGGKMEWSSSLGRLTITQNNVSASDGGASLDLVNTDGSGNADSDIAFINQFGSATFYLASTNSFSSVTGPDFFFFNNGGIGLNFEGPGVGPPVLSAQIYAGVINKAGFQLWDGSSLGLSDSGAGRIRYNSGTSDFEKSLNGGAYVPLSSGGTVTGTGTPNTITKWTSTTAVGNSSVTDDGTTVAIGGSWKTVVGTGQTKIGGTLSSGASVAALQVGGNAVGEVIAMQNGAPSGYTDLTFFGSTNSSASPDGAIGFGNSSVAITGFRGTNFLYSGGGDWVIGNGGGNQFTFVGAGGTGGAAEQFADGTGASVSAANTGRIRYNNGSGEFEESVSGGAYSPLTSGTGLTSALAIWTSAKTLGFSSSHSTFANLDAVLTLGDSTVSELLMPDSATAIEAANGSLSINAATSLGVTTPFVSFNVSNQFQVSATNGAAFFGSVTDLQIQDTGIETFVQLQLLAGISGLPSETCGAGSAIVKMSSTGVGTCGVAGGGSGATSGSGTVNNVVMWKGSASLGDLAGSATFNGDLVPNASGGAEIRGATVTSATVPTLVPNSLRSDTGVGASGSGTVSLIAQGAEQLRVSNGSVLLLNALNCNASTGCELSTSNASATVPTLVPNRGSATSGVGADVAGDVSAIANGVEIIRVTPAAITLNKTTTVAAGNLIVSAGAIVATGTASSRSTGFNEISGTAAGTFDTTAGNLANTGVLATANATISAGVNSLSNIALSGTASGGTFNIALQTLAGDVQLNVSSGTTNFFATAIGNTASSFSLIGNVAASATVPTLIPNRASATTGIGADIAGHVSIIAGGSESERCSGASCLFIANVIANSASGYELINNASSSTLPVVIPNRTDTTTGIGANASGQISLIAGATEVFRVASTGSVAIQAIAGGGASSFFLSQANASSTVPTFSPNKADTTTGIGAQASGNMSFIVGGTEIGRASTSQWTNMATETSSNTSGWSLVSAAASSTVPTIIPNRGSATSGIGADVVGDVSVISFGAEQLRFTPGGITILETGILVANSTSGFRLSSGGTSSTVPVIIPNRSDATTGIGAQAAGNISLIGAGVESARVTSTAFTSILKLQEQAHVLTTGTALTVSNLSCNGTGTPAVTTSSTDVAGVITENTLATQCTLTFAATYTNAPFCQCSPTSGTPFLVGCTSTATTLVFNNASATGDVITYTCTAPTGST